MKNKAIEEVARVALNKILSDSIVERSEYGGMIYKDRKAYFATAARTQGYGNTVNLGQWGANRGCPAGTTPVAFYHTHPNAAAARIPMEYNKFSDEDMNLAKDLNLDAYLGTLDGSFFMYDPVANKVFPLMGRLKNTPTKVE